VKNYFLTQNFTEIGQSGAELWPKNYFENGGRPPSWILKTLIFDHVAVIEFQMCICVPNFVEIG